MIAKIGRGKSLFGALSYNHQKIEKENGQIIHTHKMMETPDGTYSIATLCRSFESYLAANRNTEKPVLHISLNPGPKDQVSDEKFRAMAAQYMLEMGYGEQPYVVYKHTDIERTHIHIVSVCVNEEGRKISDKFEKRRSMAVCRNMEKTFGLLPVDNKEEKQSEGMVFHPVDYTKGNIKSQIASIVRYLPSYYKFQTLGEYNALLSLFNITAEKVEGELHGKLKHGLVYFALNDQGEKCSNPFKASLFGKNAGFAQLELHFAECKENAKSNDTRNKVKMIIAEVMKAARNEKEFKNLLAMQNINIVVRRNDSGRIYGVTFIDHNSKTVWNGSRLEKEYSANIFNNWWENGRKPEIKNQEENNIASNEKWAEAIPPSLPPRDIFQFLERSATNTTNEGSPFIEVTGELFPEAPGDDYQELSFLGQMKKKKKRKPGRQT
ncbi:conjugal transfer protein MobB [Chryseobacterium populi]|uniref:Relaxase/mobilization nuclease n=1 Tax=Chryseobacterium populi TaxID=1144316 RepID=J2T8E3_9FLAO|nr:conjugal transfer protein MobB [Chryseobacterium populi]EJL74362.1 relaxase/mobilization nuclease [Chryseobacterium populi]